MDITRARTSRLAAIGAVILLSHCGTMPEAGPTPAQIADRTKDVETGSFETHDGKQLGYIKHLPTRSGARDTAFIYLHGIESHSGWFDEAARQLASRGYPVFSLDRRGSGINRENRGYLSGHVEKGTNLVEDINQAVQIARRSDKIEKVHLIGLSWGGKYAMAYEATYPNAVDGLILITPGMKAKVDLSFGEKLSVFADLAFAPTRQHRIPIEAEMFTTTPKHLDYIKKDPLKLNTVSARFLWQSLRMDSVVEKLDDGLHPPMLVFLAGKDQIIDNEATRELVTRDPSRSVTVIEYADQTHSIQLDAPERLTRDIVRWVEALPEPD